jgi:hypothetical protein
MMSVQKRNWLFASVVEVICILCLFERKVLQYSSLLERSIIWRRVKNSTASSKKFHARILSDFSARDICHCTEPCVLNAECSQQQKLACTCMSALGLSHALPLADILRHGTVFFQLIYLFFVSSLGQIPLSTNLLVLASSCLYCGMFAQSKNC